MLEQQKVCQMVSSGRLCRFCLFEDADCEERPLIHLFQNFDYEDVTEKIQNCLKLTLTSNDKIPPVICQSCMEKVNCFNDFLELCSKSEKQLERFYGLEQSGSNTSQSTDQVEPSIAWISEERIRTVGNKTESDYSINYLAENQEQKRLKLCKKKSVNLRGGKSTVMLMTQTQKPKGKLKQPKVLKTPYSFKCKFCRKKFASIYDYQHHTKLMHEGETIYKCGKCDKIFLDQEKCLQHEKNHKIECKICNMQVLAKNMGMHLYKHAEKFRTKPAVSFKSPDSRKNLDHSIACKICQKTFKTESRLTAHMKKMHETKKIRFSANKQHRSRKLKLKIRLKQLLKKRSYKCKFCGKKFLALEEVQEHMKTHNENRKKCPKCKKTFLSKKHFDKHILECFCETTTGNTIVQRTLSLPTVKN